MKLLALFFLLFMLYVSFFLEGLHIFGISFIKMNIAVFALYGLWVFAEYACNGLKSSGGLNEKE